MDGFTIMGCSKGEWIEDVMEQEDTIKFMDVHTLLILLGFLIYIEKLCQYMRTSKFEGRGHCGMRNENREMPCL